MNATPAWGVWITKAAAVGWLRYDRQCVMACWERSPVSRHIYRPDVLGLTTSRKLIEIEIKQTLADFRANNSKRGLGYFVPHQFYFLVPLHLVEKVRAELPDGAGLLTIGQRWNNTYGPQITCEHRARVNRDSRRLTTRECVWMAKDQSGSLHRTALALAKVQASARAKKGGV